MSLHTIKCPSGLVGEVRAFKVHEANMLADPRQQRSATSFDKVLEGCWLRTLDPSVYTFEKAPVWSEILVADRFAALVGVRIATYGAEYDFHVNCTDPSCRKRFPWFVNLEEDLVHKDVPKESLAKFVGGDNRFKHTLGGKTVWHKLLTGADEALNAARIREFRDQSISAGIAARIVEVEGVEDNDLLEWLAQLDMGEVVELMDAFDEVDGGIDTEITVRCQHCELEQEVELPFGKEFFLPRRKSSKRKKASARQVT
jgi:hypothetical protein